MSPKDKILSIIFLLLFSIYILGLNNDFSNLFENILFWIPILGMLSLLSYQIFNFKNNEYLILFELFLFYISLHLIYQYGYFGLGSTDAYSDFNFFKSILTNGNFHLGEEISGWPVLHLISSSIVLITGLNPLIVAKYLPTFISSIIILPLYLLTNSIYSNKKVALLACLIFSTIPQFIKFEGYFVRETIAIFFMVLIFYIIYTSKQKDEKNKSLAILFLFLVPILVLSHHFSSFIFLILLIIYLSFSKISSLLTKKIDYKDLKGKINFNTIFLICLVCLFAYWAYSATMVWENLGRFTNSLIGITEINSYIEQAGLGGSIVSLRGNLIYYGFFCFNLLLGLILLIKVFLDQNKEKIEDLTFTTFLFFCGIYGVTATFFLGSLIYPDRLLTFGWIFGVIPLSGFILTLKRMESENNINQAHLSSLRKVIVKNKKIVSKFFVILIFSFMIFNIYNIDPDYIEKNYMATGVSGDIEYSMANTIIFEKSYSENNSTEIYYGYGGAINAIFDRQSIESRKVGKDLSRIDDYEQNIFNTDRIVIINENIFLPNLNTQKKKSLKTYNEIMTILSYKNSSDMNKIGDFGNNIYILTGTGKTR